MSITNQLLSKTDLVKLVLDVYDNLNSDKRNAYNIGIEVGKKRGKEFRLRIQQAKSLVGSFISDLLVEILNPLILEDNLLYNELKTRYLGEFLSGVVKATV